MIKIKKFLRSYNIGKQRFFEKIDILSIEMKYKIYKI